MFLIMKRKKCLDCGQYVVSHITHKCNPIIKDMYQKLKVKKSKRGLVRTYGYGDTPSD